MLATCGYRHALGMCNSYCFSAATVVWRTRLSFLSRDPPFGLAVGLVVGTGRRLLNAVKNRQVLCNLGEIFSSWANLLWVFNFLWIWLCFVGSVVCDVSIDRGTFIFRGSSPRTSHRNP